MVLVKEATMKPRTRTLGAIGAAVVTTGLVLGLAFAGSSAASGTDRTAPTTVSMPMSEMPEMGSMMTGDSTGMAAMITGDSTGMATMVGSTDMSAMHSMMHQLMKGTVDDDVLAQCDQAHAAMAGSMTTTPAQGQSNHEAHHGGTGS